MTVGESIRRKLNRWENNQNLMWLWSLIKKEAGKVRCKGLRLTYSPKKAWQSHQEVFEPKLAAKGGQDLESLVSYNSLIQEVYEMYLRAATDKQIIVNISQLTGNLTDLSFIIWKQFIWMGSAISKRSRQFKR
jgi:hypothetical protein